MTGVLAHTLVWTGVLIAAVLLLRRPVARAFGPQCAYALWALPLLRLLLPPITLPAWMAPPMPVPVPVPVPVPAPVSVPASTSESAVLLVRDAALAGQAPATLASVPVGAAPLAEFDLMARIAELPLLETALLVWLCGAGVFLWRRFAAYFELRDGLLIEGREVGRIGGLWGAVRLIETPATPAPLAMGVLDPVIALPPGFMALHDRQARDLALAHELAHHRGGDLLVNVLVQPLFALHWFNPLGRYGWLALRRDQEAACDARVIGRSDRQTRAAYAALIARFAAAVPADASVLSGAALTAPMACPVLGEKSIIHRLRSLSMSDPSPRRRMVGRALLGAGLLILPLTASISYAASEASQNAPAPPAPPAGPDAPPAPPAPPQPPEAPLPAQAPEAPVAPELFAGDGNGDEDRKVIVSERTIRDADGKERRVKIVRRFSPDGAEMNHAQHEEMAAALREGLAEADREMANMEHTIAIAMVEAEGARGTMPRVIVRQECRPGSTDPASAVTAKDGTQVVSICQSRVQASARAGLEEARAEIARDKDIPAETRKELLDQLDRQIARWKDKEG